METQELRKFLCLYVFQPADALLLFGHPRQADSSRSFKTKHNTSLYY